MRRSKVLAKIRDGKVARICGLSSYMPYFPRIAAEYGYDAIWVDGIFLGPGDLSLRLGCTPAVDHPQIMAAQEKIAAASRKHGKAWGRPIGNAGDAKKIIDLGAQLVAFGSTYGAIFSHLRECGSHFDDILGRDG